MNCIQYHKKEAVGGRQASCFRIIFSALLNRYGRNQISHCQGVFALVNYGLAESGFLCLVGQRRLHRVWYIARGLRHFPHDKSEIRCGDQRGGVGVDIPLLCAQQTVCRFISGGNGAHTMTVSLKGSIFSHHGGTGQMGSRPVWFKRRAQFVGRNYALSLSTMRYIADTHQPSAAGYRSRCYVRPVSRFLLFSSYQEMKSAAGIGLA
ncbi:Uncharacterised protein [Klebsiella pneumoniae]|nr:Uncharacterised protein [Klebsiella pneumoniae]